MPPQKERMDCRTEFQMNRVTKKNNLKGISGLNRLHFVYTFNLHTYIKVIMWLYMRFIQLKGNVFQKCKPKSNLAITLPKKRTKIHRTNIFAMINIKAWWLESVYLHKRLKQGFPDLVLIPDPAGFSTLPGRRCLHLGSHSPWWELRTENQLDYGLGDWVCLNPWVKGSFSGFQHPDRPTSSQ